MKKNKEVQNILVVSLNDKFSKRVACVLSEKLDMFNLDCYDMVVYDLINPKEVLEKCGLEYFQKRERGVIKSCSSYLNTCISISFDLIYKHLELFEKSLIFYIKLPYEKITKVPNQLDFDNRDNYLQDIADEIVTLDKKSCNMAVNCIIEKMGEIYENN